MRQPTVVICVDGLDPEYLDACETPVLRHMGRQGFLKIGRCVMPSVTNVNNVSLVTASYPMAHGICSNYRLVRETGEEGYLESSEFVLAESMFQRAGAQGNTSILATAKDKLRTLLAAGVTVSVSSERPPDWVVEGVGPPPGIYTLEVNGWVIRAASFMMARQPADLVYIATTDYAMHTFAPDAREAREHMTVVDDAIGRLVDDHPEATVLVTADHGMSAKRRMVALKPALERYGIRASPVPIIKDRYVVHHSNLGGSIFVYLESADIAEALKVLRGTPGVEEALGREEAVKGLRLHHERIGDILVAGEEDVVFGDPAEVSMPPGLRSHGSYHERRVPIIGYNGAFEGFSFEENRDVGRYVFERVLDVAARPQGE